jgi:predicted dehydrogenase
MKNTKIQWGIIGLGKVAQKFADDLAKSEDGVLYAVASRDIAKARAFKETYAPVRSYGSYEDLARDPDIDVVYVATPHSLHFENTMLCLSHGKAVLCEKPMGMDGSEVKIGTAEAVSKNLFLMEAMWTRFIPATEKLIDLLGSGIIGKPLFLHADFGFKTTPDPYGRLFDKRLGGGSLMDIGIYPIFLSLLTLGIPNEIKAMARLTETGVDSYCAVLFDHPSSAKAILESSLEADTPTEAIIYGEKGSIRMHSRFHHSQKISVFENGGSIQDFELPFEGHGYRFEIEEVNRCLLNNETESRKMPHRMSLDLIGILDRVKEEIGLDYGA